MISTQLNQTNTFIHLLQNEGVVFPQKTPLEEKEMASSIKSEEYILNGGMTDEDASSSRLSTFTEATNAIVR